MLPARRSCGLSITYRPQVQARFRRCYSYDRSRPYEQVAVPCRGDGSITLDIWNPPSTPRTKLRSTKSTSLVITLPGLAGAEDHLGLPDNISSVLAELSGLAVVQLNYRSPPGHRFPKPLHDVLTGYDWIVKHLLPKPPPVEIPSLPGRANEGANSTPPVPNTVSQSRIGVFGSHIGGSLALALGLTECRSATSLESLSEHPARIAAVATRDAVPDWLAPHQTLPEPSGSAPESSIDQIRADRQDLLKSSQAYFHAHRPTDVLDPFASPTYFFRTPSIDALPDPSTFDRMTSRGHSKAEPWMNLMVQPQITGLNFFSAEFRNRSYSRKYPPLSMEPVTLPDMMLAAREGGEYWAQNEQLARMVRRAMARQVLPIKAGERSRDLEEEYVDEEEVKKEKKRQKEERGEELRAMTGKMHARVRVEAIEGDSGAKMSEDEVQKLADFFWNKLAKPG